MNDVEKKFVEHIKLRALGDQFIDKNEEKEILHFAINEGVTMASAKSALRMACLRLDYVLESYVEERGRASLIKSLEDEQVDKAEFDAALQEMLEVGKGFIDEAECRKRLKKMILEGNIKTRQGLFKGGSWFNKIPD